MPLKILPKKSWHVLKRENIERVKRDEAEARKAEKEKQARIQLAEQEARSDLLRKRARQRLDIPSGSGDTTVLSHVDVSAASQQGSEELQREKREDREKEERRIGVLTYLGQSVLGKDKKASEPWYAKKVSEDEKSQRMKQKKELMDPLLAINEAQKKLNKMSGKAMQFTGSRSGTGNPSPRTSTGTSSESKLFESQDLDDRGSGPVCKKPKSHKRYSAEDREVETSGERKSKKSKKKKKKEKKSKGPSMEELRKERLKREKESRAKTEMLLRTAAI